MLPPGGRASYGDSSRLTWRRSSWGTSFTRHDRRSTPGPASALVTHGSSGSLGIVIGGSGNGEQIAANKVRGVRAALAWSEETARLAREHNDANVVSLGARMHDEATSLGILEAFLGTPYSGDERHTRRIGMLSEYEQTRTLPPVQ